ncbi:MAG: ATP-binding protein [Lachnospiraceae bacterium]|nr:ATP-binding protein [Lachnospiraceae bacterium]
MLLEFKTNNYKSFAEEANLIMSAAPKQKGLDYSLCREKIKGKEIRGLSTSVLYGPNASGKTNIISAMDVLRAIILRGNIKNTEEQIIPNPAAANLELIPNNQADGNKPVEFVIDFTESGYRIRYELIIYLGAFMETESPRKIVKEELTVNGEMIYKRNERLTIGTFKTISDHVHNYSPDSMLEIAEQGLDPEELFLTNGFRLIYSGSFTKLITDWFTNKFMVICRADSMQLIKRFSDPQKSTIFIEKTTNDAAKVFGINSNAIGYMIADDDSETKLCSIFKSLKDKKNIAIAADIFESYGTIRFITIFPLVIKALLTGSVLIVDEFDASIHPMALNSIITIFHNDDINVNHAQLIFNTHNPIFLNSNIFRRDEIKFVEREEDTNRSVLYALSDFGTTGDRGVRQHEDYMKNYFIGRYGAIKDIDFTPIFEELLAREINE